MEFCKIPRMRAEIAAYLGLKTSYHAMQKYILPLVETGDLACTLLDKPKSKYQKFMTKMRENP